MFAFTAPVMTSPSAWRGEATNCTPNLDISKTTFPSALSSDSQPPQLPATTERSLNDRPSSERIPFSNARTGSGSPVTVSSPLRVLLDIEISCVYLTRRSPSSTASSGEKRHDPRSMTGSPSLRARNASVGTTGSARLNPFSAWRISIAGRPRKRAGNSGAYRGYRFRLEGAARNARINSSMHGLRLRLLAAWTASSFPAATNHGPRRKD